MGRKTALAAMASVACATLGAPPAEAFCGFYVGGSADGLYNDATHVALMREGTRTVISMANDYRGPPEDFALVVPVPVVLEREQVRTLPPDVFDHLEQFTAPRLVEYWERDPCNRPSHDSDGSMGSPRSKGTSIRYGVKGPTSRGVTVEAQFDVNEYQVLILSASESAGLDTWLREEGYAIPEGAEPALRPYVESGAKFFVAKVDASKVKMEEGRAMLSPLRFYYDSERFELPVRLGLINASGPQDLIVYILADQQRYEVANYPNVFIPTNLDVVDEVKGSFPRFYTALFDAVVAKNPGAVVTEYAWNTGTCDPCAGPPLTSRHMSMLGANVLPAAAAAWSAKEEAPARAYVEVKRVEPRGAVEESQIEQALRACYISRLTADPAFAGDLAVTMTVEGTRIRDVAIQRDDATESGPRPDASPKSEGGVGEEGGGAADAQPDGGEESVGGGGDEGVGGGAGRGGDEVDRPEPQRTRSAFEACVLDELAEMTVRPAAGTTKEPAQIEVDAVVTTDTTYPGQVPPGFGTQMVVTRLHARYTADELGEDLVFRRAPPVVGGREREGERGTEVVEQGPDNFQARYAIRHRWAGEVACERPTYGRWGGPPSGDSPSTTAARGLAFAPRDGVSLAAWTETAVPELDIAASPPPPRPGALAPRVSPEGPRRLAVVLVFILLVAGATFGWRQRQQRRKA